MAGHARRGLRVLAVACRRLPPGSGVPGERADAERDLCLLGLTAMLDPARPEVPAAIGQVHRAGIRVDVVTGDNGLTAAAIAREVGIGAGGMQVVTGTELDAMTERQLEPPRSAPGPRSSSPEAHQKRSCASPTRCARRGRSSR